MKRYLIAIMALVAAAFVGCESSKTEGAMKPNQGQLRILGLQVNGEEENTKAIDSDSVAYHHIFEVTITDNATGKVVDHYDNNHDMPLTLVLDAGTYNIVARTAQIESQIPADGKTVAFENPQYLAEETVDIVAGELTPITLVAHFSTAKVSVAYSELFEKLYPCEEVGETYSVEVSCSNGEKILFERGEERSADFLVTADDLTMEYQLLITRMTNAGVLEEVASGVKPMALEGGFLKMAHQYNLMIDLQ